MRQQEEYSISEYNSKTQKYTTIGYIHASTAEVAKLKFIEQTDWKPKPNTTLFARIPICR